MKSAKIQTIALAAIAFPFAHLLMAAEKDAPPTPLTPPEVLTAPKPGETDETRKFQGIPGIERASNGRLWAVWYGGGKQEGPDNIVMLNTSTDDGETWSDIKIVIDIARPIRCFDPVVWIDPDKRLWLFWAQAISHPVNAHTWAMVTEDPEDENPTWGKPFLVAKGVMMNKPTILESGDWLLPISDWEGRRLNTPKTATANVVVSKDYGKTFQPLGGALVPPNVRTYDEQMVVERKDGSLLMLIRTKYGIGEATSDDDGKTWSAVTPSKLPHPASRFFIRRLSSGNLLLIKHWPLDKKLRDRDNLTAFISKDDGVTWEGGLLLDAREDVSYPDGVQGDDGVIRIIYDYSRFKAREILMATFTEEDVLAAKDVSGKVRLRVMVNKALGRPFTEADLRTNEDGAPLAQGAPAGWKSETAKIADFNEGAPLFSNRPYKLHEVPTSLADAKFLQGNLESNSAVCTADGIAYVLTPSKGRNRDSLHDQLIKQGFSKAAVKEFLLFDMRGGSARNLVSTYQKAFKAGDEIKIGQWGVILIPKAQ